MLLSTCLAVSLLLSPGQAVRSEPGADPQTLGSPPSRQELAKETSAFSRRPVKDQQDVVAALQKQLQTVESPLFASLRLLASKAAQPSAPRTDAFPQREARKKSPSKRDPRRDADLVQHLHYVFGLGTIDDPAPDPKNKQKRAEWEAAVRTQAVHTAMLGMLPGADAALAELMRELDADPSADRFAAFLESWRNGDESFYEALDRTAGTKDDLFFYDAMLGDFASTFAHGAAEQASLSGLQDTHDALQRAFLAYRQYRAFREAIAWSIVLPPECPLPRCLARYEAPVPGAYSLRQQVDMVLAALDHDAAALVARVTASAEPIQKPLWQGTYDPYPRWTEIFNTAMETMLTRADNTDQFLQQERQRRTDWANEVRSLTRDVLHPKATPR